MNAPAIMVQNRQRKVRFDLDWLRRFASLAVECCLCHRAAASPPLPSLGEVAVSIISDEAIARVHVEFMQVEGPTDVITFNHGEILISAATAKLQAADYSQELEHELGLYIIHGLLHLNGYKDKRPADAAVMRKLQARLLKQTLAAMKKTGS